MESNKKNIPEIRFPEFMNDGEWRLDTIETIFSIRNGYTPSKANPLFWENGTIPWFRMEDIRKSGHILSDAIQHITPKAVKGSGLIPAYSIIVATTATIGEHALTIVDSLANQRFTFLTKCKSFEKRIDMLYFHYFMFIIDEWCKRNTNAGGLLSVNMDSFKRLVVPYPPTIAEQKRIAECFYSLDKVIESIRQKLEQLKAHRKGLMQKLFPAPGKSVPECRFKEFENAGEWLSSSLNEIIETVTPARKLQVSEYKSYGKYPIIDQSQKYIVAYSDTIDALTNMECFDAIVFGDHTCALKFVNFPFIQGADGIKIFSSNDSNKVSTNYLYQYLSAFPIESKEYKRHFSALKEIVIKFPSDVIEQQKIAACLSSIDNVINLYSNKLDILERHKQALRQRLFPTI